MDTELNSAGIIDLDGEAAQDAALVGSKAANLALMRSWGERVPDGIVALPNAEPGEVAAAAIDRFGDVPIAVRSSSLAEDLASASFAGQYRTLLEVSGPEAILRAIEDVRASADDARLRRYTQDGASSMPVLLMPMVSADAAGVAFSANPVTGEDEVIIEAVRGLGDLLVSGLATPQRFVLNGELVEEGATDQPALSASQAREIAALTRRLAERFDGPQDVEWAVQDGEVYVLQARPITALPVKPEVVLPAPRETWLRADENHSQPVRPLEFAVWAPRLERTSTDVFAEVGAPVESMRYRSIGGWMYARFIPPMDQGKDDQSVPPGWLFGLLMRIIPPMRSRLRTAGRMWNSDVAERSVDEWETTGRVSMRQRTRDLRFADRRSMDDEELADHFEAVLDHLQEASDVHFRLFVLGAFLPTGHLGVLAERMLGWESDKALQLIQGYSTVVDAADDLGVVAEAFKADPSAANLLSENSAQLVEHPGPAGDAFRAHLDTYGHQIVGMDLAHPTWAEDPAPLLSILRARLDHQESSRPNGKAAADALEKEARNALADRPEDLVEFDRALAAARRGISLGDDTETDVLEVLGIVRYVAWEAGERFTDRGLLVRPDDVLFLTEQELLGGLRGEAFDDDIARRRGEYLWAKGHRGPKRYGPEPAAMPSVRWAPGHARPFLEAMVWSMDKMAAPTRPEPAGDGVMVGTAASPGRATGTVRVVRDPSEFDRIQPNDVLVCHCTIAAWSVVFPMVSAIVTEVGGPLSHPGILAREFGIPAVLGVDDATTLLSDGQLVTVDGSSGRVETQT